MGIEPTSKAWEASILPLNYARSGKQGQNSIGRATVARRVGAGRAIKRILVLL
jgi:hypothetical protein